jgi:hypothetical protein
LSAAVGVCGCGALSLKRLAVIVMGEETEGRRITEEAASGDVRALPNFGEEASMDEIGVTIAGEECVERTTDTTAAAVGVFSSDGVGMLGDARPECGTTLGATTRCSLSDSDW